MVGDTIVAKPHKSMTCRYICTETCCFVLRRAPGVHLVGLFAALSGRGKAEVLREFAGQGFGQSFKPALADLMIQTLSPMAAEMRLFAADPAEIDRILEAGAQKARTLAEPVIEETKRLVGFWRAKA